MRYLVRVDDGEREVIVDSDGLRLDGDVVDAHLSEIEGTPVRLVRIGDEVHRVIVRREAGGPRGQYTLWLAGYRFHVEALDERTRAIRELADKQSADAGPAPLVAPMPGMIVRVSVAEGDRVQAGQGIVVMEAMKMENELRAPASGTIKRVHAVPGTAVEKGTLLVELE